MGLAESSIFYLVIGCAVAAAIVLAERSETTTGECVFRSITAVFFWPLYLPTLLGKSEVHDESNERTGFPEAAHDETETAIEQVEAELETAFKGLDGWAEDVLARESSRIKCLQVGWRRQACRIRELDRLLAQAEWTGSRNEPSAGDERFRGAERARQANLERLRSIRQRMHDDLLSTLAGVRELVSLIHVAKFSGAPASRAEQLVAQIAATVERLTDISESREGAARAGS